MSYHYKCHVQLFCYISKVWGNLINIKAKPIEPMSFLLLIVCLSLEYAHHIQPPIDGSVQTEEECQGKNCVKNQVQPQNIDLGEGIERLYATPALP